MTDTLRRYGVLCALSAVITTPIGLSDLVLDGHVPITQWSYPLSPAQLWLISVPLAVAHLMEGLGFAGLALARPYGDRRAVDVSVRVAVAGFVLFAVAELLSAAIGSQAETSTAAGLVSAVFGVATLLTVAGGLAGGVATLRSGRWPVWGGAALVGTALVLLLVVTPANIAGAELPRTVGLVVWGLLFVPLGLAVARSADDRQPSAGPGLSRP